jgi:hypothetical protein
MNDIKSKLAKAAAQLEAKGGWITVTFQDGHVLSFEPDVIYENERYFVATDLHGDLVRHVLDHVESVRVTEQAEDGVPL